MKNYYRISLLITTFASLSYLGFILYKNYNSPENIEERCINKFQKEVKKGEEKSDEEWGLNLDMANENYFKCMNIP